MTTWPKTGRKFCLLLSLNAAIKGKSVSLRPWQTLTLRFQIVLLQITQRSTDESESVNIIQQLSDGGIQVAKTGKAFELQLEADNFECILSIKPKYQRHWGQSFVEKIESARKKMGYGIATGSDVG